MHIRAEGEACYLDLPHWRLVHTRLAGFVICIICLVELEVNSNIEYSCAMSIQAVSDTMLHIIEDSERSSEVKDLRFGSALKRKELSF